MWPAHQPWPQRQQPHHLITDHRPANPANQSPVTVTASGHHRRWRPRFPRTMSHSHSLTLSHSHSLSLSLSLSLTCHMCLLQVSPTGRRVGSLSLSLLLSLFTARGRRPLPLCGPPLCHILTRFARIRSNK